MNTNRGRYKDENREKKKKKKKKDNKMQNNRTNTMQFSNGNMVPCVNTAIGALLLWLN